MSIPRCSAYHARSASGSRTRKNTPPMPATRSATHKLPRTPDELGEDIAMRAELLETRILPLGSVRLGNGQVGRGPDLFRDGQHPFDQCLDARPGRPHLAA